MRLIWHNVKHRSIKKAMPAKLGKYRLLFTQYNCNSVYCSLASARIASAIILVW